MASGSSPNSNVIDFVEISSTGNATDFGDLSASILGVQASASATRCVFAGGQPSSLFESVQFGSLGNAVDYGDLVTGTNYHGCTDNSVRGIAMGGSDPSNDSTKRNVIQYWNLASTGNSVDFGDLTSARNNCQAVTSNGHGGLQEFQPRAPELYSPTGTVVPRGGGVGDTAIVAGGESPSSLSSIETYQISTLGNAQDFGDLVQNRHDINGAAASALRCLILGGSGASSTINYFEFSTKGNAAVFGTLTGTNRRGCAAHGNDTRGIAAGGFAPSVENYIDYVTYATLGNSTDFGDMTVSLANASGAGSNTRMIMSGGYDGGSPSNVIQYITTASTGDATDFGDLQAARHSAADVSSTTRNVTAGGFTPSQTDMMGYVTISSTGNATDFGNLSAARGTYGMRASNQTRGVFAGGYDTGDLNVIDFITIATTGNASDFGDLQTQRRGGAGYSNGHGGLS